MYLKYKKLKNIYYAIIPEIKGHLSVWGTLSRLYFKVHFKSKSESESALFQVCYEEFVFVTEQSNRMTVTEQKH